MQLGVNITEREFQPLESIMQISNFKNSKELGQQIREVRKSLKLTQAEVAFSCNVGVRFIVDLEAGKPTIQLEKALNIIFALGGRMSVEWL